MRLIRSIYPYIGLTFATAGLLHIFLGFIIFHSPFRDMLRAGVFNSIGFAYDRQAAFWYYYVGVVMLFAGYLLHWILYVKHMQLPRAAGWLMVLVAAAGIVFIPYGGFWAAVPQGLVLVFGRPKNEK